MTCPNLAHSVAYLAHFNANSGPQYWNALRHLFQYVKGTSDHKLIYMVIWLVLSPLSPTLMLHMMILLILVAPLLAL